MGLAEARGADHWARSLFPSGSVAALELHYRVPLW
jgi:hypothetical protein